MLVYADLQLHSKYSRATSINSDLEHFYQGALLKGLNLLGTGDFTHPKWFNELKQKLEQVNEAGVYKLKEQKEEKNSIYFILQGEVSTIYETPKGVKKVHHLVYAPTLEDVEKINDAYSKKWDLSIDGRPIFAGCSSAELVELTMSACKQAVVIPSHSFTPWFGAMGSMGGFNSIQECYEDQVKHIFAIETGLSADPAMCWTISKLDEFALVSGSDAHSPNPERIGREACVFDLEKISFKELFDAIRKKDKKRFLYTIEFFPDEGKYHWDGHRKCDFSCPPDEAEKKYKNKCPVCRRSLTLGVEHRFYSLADREKGFVPPDAIPFKHAVPLIEVISVALGKNVYSEAVKQEFARLASRFGTELNVLLNASAQEIEQASVKRIAEAITRIREEKVGWAPGYDGVYGKIRVFEEDEKKEKHKSQKSLQEFF